MLKKGDVISYGTTGVCKVEGECEQTVKGQKKRYIVLKPVHQVNSTLYVPVDNDELKTKFKPLLTGDEIEEIIKEMPVESSLWKESSSERAELYSQVLESGDRKRENIVSQTETSYCEGQTPPFIRRTFFQECGKSAL